MSAANRLRESFISSPKKDNIMNSKPLLLALAAIGVILTALFCSGAHSAAATYSAHVVRVVDGDTICVRDNAGALHKIRLALIDAPELAQPYGQAAKQRLAQLVLQQRVDLSLKCIDKYNREVCYVSAGGEDVSLVLLTAGLAMHYHLPLDDCSAADAAERAAKKQRIGLWAQPCPEPPWRYRHRQKLQKR